MESVLSRNKILKKRYSDHRCVSKVCVTRPVNIKTRIGWNSDDHFPTERNTFEVILHCSQTEYSPLAQAWREGPKLGWESGGRVVRLAW